MPVAGAVDHPERLLVETVTFPSDGVTIDAYLARPRDGGARPGIIVIHEAFGVDDHIRDVAQRLANVGFTALAPNLYARVGAPTPGDWQSVMTKMLGLADDQIVQDLEAAATYLRSLDNATSKVGCIGFCAGGRQALLFACRSRAVDAVIDCWGGFITRATPTERTTPQRPTPVIDLVDGIRCPVFAVFGAEDQNPSPADAEALQARLAQAGKTAIVKVFVNAGHAFFNDRRPQHYREDAAFALWPQITAFFNLFLW